MSSFSIILIASSKIFFSISCLSLLNWLSSSVIFSASSILSVKKSFKASSSHPILPQALILGAIPKDIVFELTCLYPEALSKALSPGFLVTSTNFNPSFAITLFSSINGTISEIVPTQTISKYFKYSFSSSPNFIPKAWVSLNTTPHPAKLLNGYLSLSFLFKSITAIAGGNISIGSWWSVTIVSKPKLFAYSISSIPEIPQSTVIINVYPSSCILSIAFLLSP